MKTAQEEVINIHIQQEIDRLKKDIIDKCTAVADLYVAGGVSDTVYWKEPQFYIKKDDKRQKI